MKNYLQFLSALLLVISIPEPEVLAQDPIDQYEGIPVIPYSWRVAHLPDMTEENFDQLDSLGIFGVVTKDVLLGNPQAETDLEKYESRNIKVIPNQHWRQPNNILTDTDAHYTKWEAEGTDPTMGEATLEYDENYTTYFNTNGIEGRKAAGN